MSIATDVSIDTVNKIVSRASGASSTTYSVNALYSYLMDYFDELDRMDDEVPMSAQTPTSYTMINGWYIQQALTQFLDGGAIQTDGYSNEIHVLFVETGTVPDASSIGTMATESVSGDELGVIVDFESGTNTYDNYKWFVRSSDPVSPSIGVNITCSAVGHGDISAPSVTGETHFANPYTLGALEGTPAIYIYQNGEPIASWWDDGHFDILIKVFEADQAIDSQKVTVTSRTWTDTFSTFEITLTTAGQNAVPLGTQNDLNNVLSEADVLDLTDGTVSNIGIDFGFTSPFQYDIGDGNGTQDYEVQIDCDGRRLSDVYEVSKYWTRDGSIEPLETGSDGSSVNGEAYRYANDSYAEVTGAPLGTFAGGKFFGARSVYFINVHPDDIQNFQIIDKSGATRNPPNYQAFAVFGVISGDRVAVYKEENGDVDKDQYSLSGSNALNTITVSGSIPNDTPDTGVIFVVDDDGTEIGYEYTSWLGSDFVVTIGAGVYSGTETAYVPYIYAQATGTSVTESSTIFVTDRPVITRVRKAGIIPFETTGTYTATGYSATAIRTTDNIYTP